MAVFVVLPVLAGCRPPPAREGGFYSDNPASRLYAIRRAGEQRDAGAIRPLVELLDDDDPAVRMFAIQALDRITGTRLGYDAYAPLGDRREAVDRWVAAVKSGQFAASPGRRTDGAADAEPRETGKERADRG